MARSAASGSGRKGPRPPATKERPTPAAKGRPSPTAAKPAQGGERAKNSAPRGKGRNSAPEGKKGAEGWLYGRHPVEAALQNPQRQLHRLIGTREALDSLAPLLKRHRQPAEILETDRSTLDDLLGPGAVHQGLALRAGPLPDLTADDVVARSADETEAVVLVLDQVSDPHNVGAILRSAAAFGAMAVMVQDRHSPEQTGVLAKSASGTLEKVPLVRVPNLVRALETLKKGGFWIAGLAADGPTTILGAKLSGKVALCLGSEGEGLRRLTREACDHLLRLPMVPGAVESLNVSNAAAVALYAARQSILEDSANPPS